MMNRCVKILRSTVAISLSAALVLCGCGSKKAKSGESSNEYISGSLAKGNSNTSSKGLNPNSGADKHASDPSAASNSSASSKDLNPDNTESSPQSDNDRGAISDKDFLSVKNSKLVTRNGKTVILRGVNLGGWMIQEYWMCPVTSGKSEPWSNLDTINAFKKSGMTDGQIQLLFDTYQDNWITEYDLDIIAKSGANCVRVPFWYRNFMLDEKGTWIDDNPDKNPGFKRLDWLIKHAGERGLYVILDMHGCPGGQSMNHSTGTIGRNDLYTNSVCRETMKKLWLAIAQRYKGNAVVAAYDIMNEPQNNDGYEKNKNYVNAWNSASWKQSNEIYREMIAAVRAVDPEHIISIEGVWRISNLPIASKESWTNMLYQVHLYDDTAEFEKLASSIANYAKNQNVAVYVGEFSNLKGIDICEKYGISWTTWTYKGGCGSNGTWFWYYKYTTPVIPGKTDFQTALKLWGKSLRTDSGNFTKANDVCSAVTKATGVK